MTISIWYTTISIHRIPNRYPISHIVIHVDISLTSHLPYRYPILISHIDIRSYLVTLDLTDIARHIMDTHVETPMLNARFLSKRASSHVASNICFQALSGGGPDRGFERRRHRV